MLDTEKNELVNLIKEVARVGGKCALSYFRKSALKINNKSKNNFDPVTRADIEAEEAMINLILQNRPFDTIIGEECDNHIGTSHFTWVLDPIDGTRAFISGVPVWTVLVALSYKNQPILGVIYQPFTDEMFVGGLGISELINKGVSESTKSKSSTKIENSVLFSTFPEIGTQSEWVAFNSLSKKTKLTRYGLDAYAFGLLAAGHIDIVIEVGLKVHDIAAPIAVIEASGGVVTDWSGNKTDGGRVVACSNSKIHEKVLMILSGSV